MHIKVNGLEIEVSHGMTLAEIAVQTGNTESGGAPVVLAVVDGRLRELHHTAEEGDDVSFVTAADGIGYEAYRRSCSMLFFAALQNVLGEEKGRAVLHFSLGTGFYYTLAEGVTVDEALLEKLRREMKRMSDLKLPFGKRSVSTPKAKKIFCNAGMADKELLFRTRIASRTNIYRLGTFEDYYYGFMVHNTSALKQFELIPYAEGLVLQMPVKGHPGEIPPLSVSEKLFRAQIQGERWAEKLGIGTVGDLNRMVISGNTGQVVLMSEALQESALAEIAEKVSKKASIKFIMVAGPSSSGKTTFSQRLAIQLGAHGRNPHFLGLDNYFVNRDEMKPGPDGKLDFESVNALDLAQFREDMRALLDGKTIRVPTFDFISGKRLYTGETMTLADEDVLVIEGLHALNTDLAAVLPEDSRFRVYISALTQLNIDEHNRVPSGDGRLIRRIVRDNRSRGYMASRTLQMWNSVRQGEEKNIFPFQESADVVFNSALPYEIAALKTYVQPLLFQVEEDDPSYLEAKRLLKFLDYFIAIPAEDIPKNSLLREFIGGGCFRL